MTDYFLDSSALVKRYAQEVGSEWVVAVTDPAAGHSILLADVSRVEVAAAFAARQRSQPTVDSSAWERALRRFLQDCDDSFLVLEVDRLVIDRAIDLTRSHRLRGYDAVQLGAALVATDALAQDRHAPVVFVSADRALVAAAEHEGVAVDNPLDHPGPDPAG